MGGAPAAGALERGRSAFQRQAWDEAHARLAEADRERALDAEDLERLALAAHLLGRDAASADLWARAHREFLARGNPARAVRCAYRLAIPLVLRGDFARGGGWIERGRRILDEHGLDGVERGWLLLPVGARSVRMGDADAALDAFEKAAAIGARFSDRDLVTLARHGQGRALIRKGETARGLALLDEIMAAVVAGEISSPVAGDVYCSVLEACGELHDVRRALEWTEALGEWTSSQGGLPAYRGQCLVHRAEILVVRGAWREAASDAQRARDLLSRPPPQRALGAAEVQLAELHRLRGDLDKAEEAYRRARAAGASPQPGLALLRLAQGRTGAARTAIDLALDAVRDPFHRPPALLAAVEIAVAAGELDGARVAAKELASIATALGVPFLAAEAAYAEGAVRLAGGDARGAAGEARRAFEIWDEVEAPFEAARARLLLGLACRALGDDAACVEVEAARDTFQRLGAAPEVARAKELLRAPAKDGAVLSGREVEVLRLVATGRTNRAIAEELGISGKTVDRHVSNIFGKLDVSSRAAATAWAFRNGIAVPAP
jgi:DNA-binding CsgD family transcriptional regulator